MPIDLEQGEVAIYEGHPSWRSAFTFYVKAAVAAAVIAALVILADLVTLPVGVGIAVGVLLLAAVVGYIKRIFTVYLISNQRLYIRTGFIARDEQQTRIERVQNVGIEQSVSQRLLRIGTVDFDTAGTDDSNFQFRGVGSPRRMVEAVNRAQRDATDGAV